MATPRPYALSQVARSDALAVRAVGHAAPPFMELRATNTGTHILSGLEAQAAVIAEVGARPTALARPVVEGSQAPSRVAG